MDEIQFKKEYQGCGLFDELYHYLTTVIPAGTRYVEAFARKENLKSQGILEHLGLSVVGESKTVTLCISRVSIRLCRNAIPNSAGEARRQTTAVFLKLFLYTKSVRARGREVFVEERVEI